MSHIPPTSVHCTIQIELRADAYGGYVFPCGRWLRNSKEDKVHQEDTSKDTHSDSSSDTDSDSDTDTDTLCEFEESDLDSDFAENIFYDLYPLNKGTKNVTNKSTVHEFV